MTRQDKKKQLRSGFTTGAAAAAAARAAVLLLSGGSAPASVPIRLLTDRWITITVHDARSGIGENGMRYAACTVIKDAGDDPDVTNRAEIGAKVQFAGKPGEIMICGGKGVGTITRPGLELSPGEPAINPGPRIMIREAVDLARNEAEIRTGVRVAVFVPNGEAIARRTLNARLGIEGGISILGTTGVVTPMSHEAYIATIESGLSVARACGSDIAVLTTGRRSERHARKLIPGLPETAFVQMGDFFGRSMEIAGEKAFANVVLAVFFGKAVKMACGHRHTHAATARLSLEHLGKLAQAACGDASLVRWIPTANTAREAFFRIRDECPQLLDDVANQVAVNARGFSKDRLAVRVALLDFDGYTVSDVRLPAGGR